MPPPTTRYALSGDIHLAYQVVGDGPLDLVLLPDWGNQLEAFWDQPLMAEVIERLTGFARVIWFDMRSAGLSDRAPEPSVAEDWAQDVRAVMDAVGLRRAAVVGHGHGGQLAILFAAAHPERVSALVLQNSYARLARAPDYPAGMPESAQEAMLAGVAASWGTGASGWTIAPSLAETPGFLEWWARMERLSGGPGQALAHMRKVFELDVRDLLPSVQAPTLVLHSAGNAWFRVDHGRYLAEHIAGAKLIERPEADHLPLPIQVDDIEEFLTGVRPAPRTDRVLLTMVFTDVVGSTETAVRLGDQSWRELLDRHDGLAARLAPAHQGRIVKSTGDGILAVFDGPAAGLRYAFAFGDAIQELGLAVRAGVHTGEVERRADDVSGVAVHVASRVQALADAGEVLATRTVRDLTAGSGLRFEPRGRRTLKGVPDEWELYAVSR